MPLLMQKQRPKPLEKQKNMDDSEYDWSDSDDAQVVDDDVDFC